MWCKEMGFAKGGKYVYVDEGNCFSSSKKSQAALHGEGLVPKLKNSTSGRHHWPRSLNRQSGGRLSADGTTAVDAAIDGDNEDDGPCSDLVLMYIQYRTRLLLCYQRDCPVLGMSTCWFALPL